MALTKQSENKITYLQVKHYSIWRELKKPVEGCDQVDVTNPRTGEKVTKCGFKYRSLNGVVTKIVKYDTGDKFATRYFGFKVHFQDGVDLYVLDMPYQSQVLRRFLRVAPNIDWSKPLTITAFKAKGEKKKAGGAEETGIWFQQGGETVRAFYTKESPRGMPPATQDRDTHEWDFKPQHRWLIERLKEDIIPLVEKAAAKAVPPEEPYHGDESEQPEPGGLSQDDSDSYQPSDDDVPF